MDVDTIVNTSTSVQAPKRPCSPALSSGYITNKDGILLDNNHNASMELPEDATVQCYDGDHETMTNVSGACRSKIIQQYVDADFSVSDPPCPLESAQNPQDFGDTMSQSSSFHDLCGSLDIDEELHNTSEGSCSPIQQSLYTLSPVEEHNEPIRLEENKSPRYIPSDSEGGYIDFLSATRQDTPLHLNATHETQNQPSDVCSVEPDLTHYQSQMDTSADQYIDPHLFQDNELHIAKSDLLVRLSGCHGSSSSIDSGYVKTCDFS